MKAKKRVAEPKYFFANSKTRKLFPMRKSQVEFFQNVSSGKIMIYRKVPATSLRRLIKAKQIRAKV